MLKFITGIAVMVLLGTTWILIDDIRNQNIQGYIANLLIMAALVSAYCLGKIKICGTEE